jgi:drug/metabolite transporter (DMT)-like permease
MFRSSSNRSPLAAAPALTATLIWGGMFPIAAIALERVGPIHLTAIRYGVASVIFLGLLALVEGRGALRYDGRFLRLFALGTLGFGGFNLLAYIGLAHTAPQNAALIAALMPLLTALVLWQRSKQAPSRTTLSFIALALTGVALVISKGNPSSLLEGGGLGGDLLVLLGALCWVRYTMGAADHPELSPLRYTALSAAAGTLSIVAIAALVGAVGWEATPSAGDVAARWWEFIYIVGAAAVVAVLAWNAAVRALGPQDTALFMNLVPVTTFAIEIARGYHPGAAEIVGAGITVSALVGANLAARRAVKPVAAPAQRRILVEEEPVAIAA